MYKLPILGTLRTAYGFVWAHKGEAFAYMLLPVVATTFIGLIVAISEIGQMQFINSYAGTRSDAPSEFHSLILFGGNEYLDVLAGIVAILVSSALYVMFAVAWHRRFLIGPERTSIAAAFVWRQRHWRFTLMGVGFAILLGIAGMAVALLGLPVLLVLQTIGNDAITIVGMSIVAIVVYMIVGLLAVSLVLVFPATAIDDERFDLVSVSPKLTRGNNWRMLVAFVLGVYVPFVLATLAINAILFTTDVTFALGRTLQGSVTLLFLALLVQQFVYYIGVACGVSCLSAMYRQFVDHLPVPKKDEPPKTPKPTGLPPGASAV